MNENEKEHLYEMLEKLVFDENQLLILKEKIEQVANGTLSSKLLRKQIIDFRMAIMERLLEFFPFYVKQSSTQKQLTNFLDHSNDKFEELEEKNRLLKEVSVRINKIYENLVKQI
ncbi:MAG: hypothetical protein ACFFEY_03770 [Candidatus Thorarchaeota archaeon]